MIPRKKRKQTLWFDTENEAFSYRDVVERYNWLISDDIKIKFNFSKLRFQFRIKLVKKSK